MIFFITQKKTIKTGELFLFFIKKLKTRTVEIKQQKDGKDY
tara:strand:+ start:278 stop:400 length:123 start_codon:yes stop_codon:yes gene_type:complete